MKRQLVYCPEINKFSVVFLFEKGDGGGSWSVRDYSRPGVVSVRYAREFDHPLAWFSARVLKSFPAPVVSTSDIDFWHRLTVEANASLNLAQAEHTRSHSISPPPVEADRQTLARFALLDEHRLMSLPKARKTADLKRILHSPNSEDWVTWNAFAIVQRLAPLTWWEHLVGLARRENPTLKLPRGWEQMPSVSLWRCVPAPREYETSSRRRLRTSGIPDWIDRSYKPDPVEGDSEIDISINNETVTVFVEAKLGSDISERTTYDPDRNQIIRNIDCLLDNARGTTPLFWMMVRDSGHGRAYTQLMQMYRRDPAKLIESLPHRDPTALHAIAQGLSIILWKDFVQAVPEPSSEDDIMLAVHRELYQRIQL